MMDDAKNFEALVASLGPGAIEAQLWQAIQMCWITLPPQRRSPENLEAEVKLRVDRIFGSMRDDLKRRMGGP